MFGTVPPGTGLWRIWSNGGYLDAITLLREDHQLLRELCKGICRDDRSRPMETAARSC